jgi:hypothetical protein
VDFCVLVKDTHKKRADFVKTPTTAISSGYELNKPHKPRRLGGGGFAGLEKSGKFFEKQA